jgi:hypothetical protein
MSHFVRRKIFFSSLFSLCLIFYLWSSVSSTMSSLFLFICPFPPTHLLCLTPLSLFCLSLSLPLRLSPLILASAYPFLPPQALAFCLSPLFLSLCLFFSVSAPISLFCLSASVSPSSSPLYLSPLYPPLSPHFVFGLLSLLPINLHWFSPCLSSAKPVSVFPSLSSHKFSLSLDKNEWGSRYHDFDRTK